VDDGIAWEIGYFYAKKSSEQKIIGIKTDFRRAGESEGAVVNAMVSIIWADSVLEKVFLARNALVMRALVRVMACSLEMSVKS
jgi:nucleoside 2-deoxyribosyltransferase